MCTTAPAVCKGSCLAALLAIVSILSVGCSAVSTRFVTGLSAEERAQAAQLPVHRERLSEGTYEIVGPVKGLSCQITFDDSYRISEDNALEELKRAAFRAGGDAVMDVRCTHLGRGEGRRRCFRSIECEGTAVRTVW